LISGYNEIMEKEISEKIEGLEITIRRLADWL
jgi:hypothetical protein